jgi:WD40 repeat protein
VGLLDENVFVFKQNMEQQQLSEIYKLRGNTLGVVDLKFNSQGNMLAFSSLDSMIRIYNIEEGVMVTQIPCKPMECCRVMFDSTGRSIYGIGELGLIKKYDIDTGENIEVLKT